MPYNDTKQLKFGWTYGNILHIQVPIGASEVLKAKSGRFVKHDGSGRVEIAGAAHTDLIGHLECEEFTASATEGADVRDCNIALDAVYRLPIDSGTYVAATHRFNYWDLGVTSNIQGVVLGTNTRKHVIVVDGDDVDNRWVDVVINPAIRMQSAT